MAYSRWPLSTVALRLASPALVVIFALGCAVNVPPQAIPTPEPTLSLSESKPWLVVSAADRTKFLAAMTAIDRGLTKDEERTLRRAVNVCYQIYDKKPAAEVQAFTQQEFTSGPTKVNPRRARKIVTAVKKWICSSHSLYTRWQT